MSYYLIIISLCQRSHHLPFGHLPFTIWQCLWCYVLSDEAAEGVAAAMKASGYFTLGRTAGERKADIGLVAEKRMRLLQTSMTLPVHFARIMINLPLKDLFRKLIREIISSYMMQEHMDMLWDTTIMAS